MEPSLPDYKSINTYVGDGVTTRWNFQFSGGYLAPEHVFIDIDGVLTPATLDGSSTVVIEPAVASGQAFNIRRRTPNATPLVNWADGADISETNLDTAARQSIFSNAEFQDDNDDIRVRTLQVPPGQTAPSVGDLTSAEGKMLAVVNGRIEPVAANISALNQAVATTQGYRDSALSAKAAVEVIQADLDAERLQFGADLAVDGAARTGFKHPLSGTVSRTVLAKASEQISVDDFGASGKIGSNSTAGFQAALTAHKAAITALEAGNASGDYSRGVPFTFKEGGRYTVTASVTPSKYLQFGGQFPRMSSVLQGLMVDFTGPGSLFSSGWQYGTVQNIAFKGTVNTDFAPSDIVGTNFNFTKFLGVGFFKFKALTASITGCEFVRCDFNSMPQGNLKVGGSDVRITDCFFSGEPADGVSGTAHTNVVHLSGLHNSRLTRNYYTGRTGTGTAKPRCLLVENTHDTELRDEWYDLSDGPGVIIRSSYNILLSGGKSNHIAQNPPVVDEFGGAVPTRFNCGMLLERSHDLVIDGHTFKNLPNSAPAFRTTALTIAGSGGQPLPGKIVIKNIIMDSATTCGEVRVKDDDNTARAFPIYCDDYERKHRPVGGTEMPVSGSTFTVPPVMRQKLAVPQSVGPAIGVPGYALPGRRIELLNLGTNTTGFNLIVSSNNPHTGALDVIRGQDGMSKIRQAGQPGKGIVLECFELGVWDVVNSTATLSFAA